MLKTINSPLQMFPLSIKHNSKKKLNSRGNALPYKINCSLKMSKFIRLNNVHHRASETT